MLANVWIAVHGVMLLTAMNSLHMNGMSFLAMDGKALTVKSISRS